MRHPFGVTVSFEARTGGGVVDGFEQPATWGDPVAVDGCAVAPMPPAELAGMVDRVSPDRVQCTVYAPRGTSAMPRDRVTVPGLGVLDVLDSADWGMNPFTGLAAGVVVLCGRFDG